jgi:ABC transporter substrate binding protein
MAAELVHRQVAVIVANTLGAPAVKAATTTIPIVFTTASDPVQIGLVASLSRPGGNVTRATQLHVEVEPKRLQLMHELVPTATIIAVLVNPTDPRSETQLKRPAGGGPHPWSAAPCPACEYRTGLRYGLRNLGSTAERRARDQHRCVPL